MSAVPARLALYGGPKDGLVTPVAKSDDIDYAIYEWKAQ